VIRGRSNRKKRIGHDKLAYKGRNVIERGDSRVKDFRRVVTHYDKLAQNSFSTASLAPIVLL
jgi:transposase